MASATASGPSSAPTSTSVTATSSYSRARLRKKPRRPRTAPWPRLSTASSRRRPPSVSTALNSGNASGSEVSGVSKACRYTTVSPASPAEGWSPGMISGCAPAARRRSARSCARGPPPSSVTGPAPGASAAATGGRSTSVNSRRCGGSTAASGVSVSVGSAPCGVPAAGPPILVTSSPAIAAAVRAELTSSRSVPSPRGSPRRVANSPAISVLLMESTLRSASRSRSGSIMSTG